MQMTCPKCHGEMRHYERSGVTLDQCNECRGIFLDRGELERIVDAENNWRGQQRPVQPTQQQPFSQPAQPQYGHGYGQHGHGYGSHGHGYGRHGHHKKRRKESFFDELFG